MNDIGFEDMNEINECDDRNGFHDIIGRLMTIALISMLLFMAIQPLVPVSIAQEPQRTFAIGSGEGIDSANPYVGIYDISYVYYGMIWDSMVAVDKDLGPRPNLAMEWWYMDGPTASSIEDPTDFSSFSHHALATDWPMGSIWEYNLTENAFWNDGEPFSAEDVAFTINMQLGANFNTFWAYQPYTRWIDHVDIINDYKVRIFFSDFRDKSPMPAAYGDFLFIPILPKHEFEAYSPTDIGFNWDGIPAIGTGPFMGTNRLRSEIIAGEVVNLVRNPFYNFTDEEDGIQKGLGAAHGLDIEIDKIQLKFFSEEATLSLGVINGEVDVAKLQTETYVNWRDNPGLIPDTVSLVDILTSTGYSKQVCINAYAEATGALNPLRLDPAVVRAAALAINKTFIIKQVYKDLGHEGVGLISPVWEDWWWDPPTDEYSWFNLTDGNGDFLWGYNKTIDKVMDFNITLANEILDEAGYYWDGNVRKAGLLAAQRMFHLFGGVESQYLDESLSFELVIDNSVFDDKLIAYNFVPNWEEIGFDIDQEIVNAATWSARIYSYAFNTMITYWSGDVDANYISFVPTSYSLEGWNEFGTAFDDYDQLYIDQAKAMNYTERKAIVDEINKWQYLSGFIVTPVYPRICFAYNTENWDNWGDWNEYPGMAVDNFWGGNPLWAHIEYVGEDEDDGISMLSIIVTALIIAAVVAAIVISMMRKKKMQQMMLLEDEEEEEQEETKP